MTTTAPKKPRNGHTALKDMPKPTVTKIVPDKSTGMIASKPLTDTELAILCVHFNRAKKLNINTQAQIRGEMIKVYAMVTEGTLPLSAGMKLMYMLDKISRSRLDEEKLDILRRGGIQGKQFIGLIIEEPPKVTDGRTGERRQGHTRQATEHPTGKPGGDAYTP